MANLMESLANDALKACIFNSVTKVYSSIKSYKGNLNLLYNNIQSLSAKNEDIVRKVEAGKMVLEEVTNEANVWLQNVKEVLDDEEIKDLLNDELRRVKDQCCFGLFLCNLYHRYGMSRLAKSKVDEIKEKLEHLPQEPVTVPKRSMELDPIPSQHCKGLDSRGMVEKRILELLKDDQVDAVGICGMGGVGKTTLAKDIKNKAAKDMFDAIFMIEISQVVNMEHIQDHIAAFIDLSLDSKHSSEQRATKLYNALKQVKSRGNNNDQPTKILIMMDNIWTNLKLDEVGIPHEKMPQFCCKLLFTSRERSVCKSMKVPDKNIVDVSMLNEHESRSLFWEQIKNVDINEVEKSVQDRLLRSCGGLPLAIVTLATSLSGRDVSSWQYFADELEKPISCRNNNVVSHDGTNKVLEASYKSILPDEKKLFFLLACLYPFGSGIPVENLMRYGIGLNLFWSANSLTEVNNQANIWTNELVSSFLLLEDDNKLGRKINNDNKYEKRVKVHDVVRSCAILCAAKDGQKMMVEAIPQWQFDESLGKYTAISLTNYKDCSRLRGIRFDMLEKLILISSLYFKLDDHDDLFQGMSTLKVLQLSRLESCPPKSIATLTHLRTLHLENCILGDGDIEFVSELVELVVLSLRGSKVKMLPCGMKKLRHLRLLDLHECKSLAIIPENVLSSLTELEGLYMLNCYGSKWKDNNSETEHGTTSSIAELRSLGRLKVVEVQVERIKQVTLSDMEFITSFQRFKFYADLDYTTQRSCYKRFKRFGVFIQEMMKFSSVNFEVKIGYSLEWLWKYPCLKTLLSKSTHINISKISDYKGLLKNLVPNLDREGFQLLEELQLRYLGVERICDGHVPPRMFSNLRHLKLEMLENLESFVLPIDAAPNLTRLSLEKCKKLKFIWMEHVAPSKQNKLLCLKYLSLARLPQLLHALGNDCNSKCPTSIDIIESQALFNTNKTVFPSLEELVITSSGMFKKLVEWDTPNQMQEISGRPSPHFSSFPNLKKLYISQANNMETGIASPSIVASLVHLESLEIWNCKKMKQVIGEETEETQISSNIIITFPKLHLLRLTDLDQLECMYQGSYKVEFPTLKKMELSNVSNMTTFLGPKNTLDFLSKKMFFNLQSLSLAKVDKLESYVLLVDAAPNLTTLYLKDCRKLKFIWMENVTQKEIYELRCLKVLNLTNLDNLLQALGNDNVNSSTRLGINKLQPLFNSKIVFPSLLKLEIEGNDMSEKLSECDIHRMQEIVARAIPHFSPFPNLKELNIVGANNMKIGIGSPSIAATLIHLESLRIRDCKKMKQVISDETKEETEVSSNIIITFPKLHLLHLDNLDQLECIYGGSYQVEFPTLKDLELCDLRNMTRFVGPQNTHGLLKKVEFPSVDLLKISKETSNIMNLYSSFKAMRFLDLTYLKWKYAFSKDMVATIGLTQLHLLEQLYISNCKNMEAVVEDIDDDEAITSSSLFNLEFPRLTRIRLWGCHKMRWFCAARHDQIVLHLPSLQEVNIEHCNGMELFSNGPIKVSKHVQVNVERRQQHHVVTMDNNGDDLNNLLHKLQCTEEIYGYFELCPPDDLNEVI